MAGHDWAANGIPVVGRRKLRCGQSPKVSGIHDARSRELFDMSVAIDTAGEPACRARPISRLAAGRPRTIAARSRLAHGDVGLEYIVAV